MIVVDGYTILQKIKQYRHITFYEAIPADEADTANRRSLAQGPHQVPHQVLIAHPSFEHISSEEIVRIENDYELIKAARSNNLVHIEGLQKIRTTSRQELVFICEYHKAKALKDFPALIRTDLSNFLEFAIGLAEAANHLHQRGILLKEINPTTLLVKNGTGSMMVNTPFILLASINPLARQEAEDLYRPDFINNVLPYISPEQTGRMNRQVDYRSDFYSFGVLFYELLTGRPPFSASDPLELIHSHIARYPVSPNKVRMDIPDMLSKITLKLLEKMPEDRYQSAFGLLSDLRRCRREYFETGFIPIFALGNRDAPEKLRLSNKMFGREEPLQRLLSVFEKVKEGAQEVLLVQGPPGIGKTRLVEELRNTVHEAGGYFGVGRYDPFHGNIPYSGMIEAIKDIIDRILGESSENMAYWKEQFVTKLGRHLALICDLMPELERITGPAPPAPKLPPNKTERTFLSACYDFIKVFAKPEHPLVMFLDDLQWVDMASLVLMEYVITGPPMPYVLFIVAFRDTEVTMTHPLAILMERIQGKGIPMGWLTLGPLGVEHIRQSIIAALSKNVVDAKALSELIRLKTNGNPFFVNQFLHTLYLRKLLYFDYQTGVWRWNEQGIKAQAFTDNVIELMSGELQKLPKETQQILQIAACIGNRFSLKLLASANDAPYIDTAQALLTAIEAGYIIAKGDKYDQLLRFVTNAYISEDHYESEPKTLDEENSFEFFHDRVHQAVYDLLSNQAKRPLHLKIGRLLLKQTDPKNIQDNIFPVVNQLNYGIDLVISEKEKNDVARLYLTAGKKAKENAAYIPATSYFNTGITLLSDNCWRDEYDLTFGLYKEKMECAFLGRNYDEAERLFDFVLDRTNSAMDKATLLNFRLTMYASFGKHREAINMGAAALKLLGQSFSLSTGQYELTFKFLWLRSRLYKRRVDKLANMPDIKDPRHRLIMKILQDMAFSIYLLDPFLFASLAFKIFELSLKYGNSATSSLGYVLYGHYLCSRMEDYELGHHLGELAVALNEKMNNVETRPRVLFWYASGVCFWRHHIRFGLKHSRQGLDVAMEHGDFNFALYHIQLLTAFLFTCGNRLTEVDIEVDKHLDFLLQSKDSSGINTIISLRQCVKCLRGETKNHLSLDDVDFSETEHIQQMMQNNPPVILLKHYLYKLQILYTMDDFEGAMEMSQRSAKLLRYQSGTITITAFYFFRAMTMLALYHQVTTQQRRHYKKSVGRYLRRFAKMAKSGPANFRHMYFILLGEKSQVEGQIDKAFSCFKDAVHSAEENGFFNMAALANELSAKLALKQGLHTLAKVFFQEANAFYLKWGALAKSHQLSRAYPQFLSDATTAPLPVSRQIDYATVVRALQAISTEIILDRLLKKLIHIVVENAGAQRVLFILKQGDTLEIKASSNIGGPIRLTNQAIPVQDRDDLLLSGIHFVHNTHTPVVIDDAQNHSDYGTDPYVIQYKPKSIVCLPVLRQSDLVAILYLENNIVVGAFTPDRIEILQLIASQAAISIENAKLYENVTQNERDLTELSGKLRSLSSELLLTEERERRRIAVDLHDRIGHALANVKMQLGALREGVSGKENHEYIHRISDLIDQSIQDTQSLTFDLSPPVLYDLGLEAAIEWLVDQTQEQHRISMAFNDDLNPKPLDESIRVLAFQATRELLFNMVKHAQAHHAWVSMKQVDSEVHIEIEDDGIGMQASKQSGKQTKKGGGFGLFSIQERLKLSGGRLEIASDPGKGTRITLIVPMQTIKEDRL